MKITKTICDVCGGEHDKWHVIKDMDICDKCNDTYMYVDFILDKRKMSKQDMFNALTLCQHNKLVKGMCLTMKAFSSWKRKYNKAYFYYIKGIADKHLFDSGEMSKLIQKLKEE